MVYKRNIRHLDVTYSWIFSPFRHWFKGPICEIPTQPTKPQHQYLTSWEWGSAVNYHTIWIFILIHYYPIYDESAWINMNKSVVRVTPRNISRHFCGIKTRCFLTFPSVYVVSKLASLMGYQDYRIHQCSNQNRYLKPNSDVYQTLTMWCLCLNLKRA